MCPAEPHIGHETCVHTILHMRWWLLVLSAMRSCAAREPRRMEESSDLWLEIARLWVRTCIVQCGSYEHTIIALHSRPVSRPHLAHTQFHTLTLSHAGKTIANIPAFTCFTIRRARMCGQTRHMQCNVCTYYYIPRRGTTSHLCAACAVQCNAMRTTHPVLFWDDSRLQP